MGLTRKEPYTRRHAIIWGENAKAAPIPANTARASGCCHLAFTSPPPWVAEFARIRDALSSKASPNGSSINVASCQRRRLATPSNMPTRNQRLGRDEAKVVSQYHTAAANT